MWCRKKHREVTPNMKLSNLAGHFMTITRHHNSVMRYCFKAGLIRQGLAHDLSKLSPTEFWTGARYYQGSRSPNNAEREATGVSLAWLHHKGRNKHHYEYWIDYSDNMDDGRGLKGIQMPRKYVAEMIFDRVSACKVYRGKAYKPSDPLDYYKKGSDKAWFINDVTKAQMEKLLTMWAEKGEEATIAYIRDVFLKGLD